MKKVASTLLTFSPVPLFHKEGKNILFVHVPKTGGSSVVNYFLSRGWTASLVDTSSPFSPSTPNWVRRISNQHLHAEILRQVVRIDRCDEVIMMVRNPTERLLSEFRYQLNHNQTIEYTASGFEGWWKKTRSNFRRDKSLHDNHIRPQVDFWFQDVRVFRFENGFHGIIDLEARISGTERITIEGSSIFLPWTNSSQNSLPALSITPSISRQIKRFYREDFAFFGYN